MKCHIRLLVLALGLLVLAASIPALAQQEKGDSEIGLNGSVIIPNSTPSATTGVADFTYGYYLRKNDQVGAETTAIIAGGFQEVFLQGSYRHLFPISNPKIYPFLGAAGGVVIAHSGSTSGIGVATGSAGMKFFVSQRTAIELAYNFQYYSPPSGVGGGGSDTFSIITVGFTHIFGGHHK